MSVWRRKANEILPHKDHHISRDSIYTVFSEILALTIEAHRNNDVLLLTKCYDFAEWCFTQKDKNLWNPAAVSFYEHLGNDILTFEAMPKWVKPGIYDQVRILLELQLPKEKVQLLDDAYKFQKR